MRVMLKSKINHARVTGNNVSYEGSLTIDKKLMEEADILLYEQVQVLNLNNGARLTTYAIEGEAGSGVICLNGAAARLGAKGDLLIILTYCHLEEAEAHNFIPRLVHVDAQNHIVETKRGIEAISL